MNANSGNCLPHPRSIKQNRRDKLNIVLCTVLPPLSISLSLSPALTQPRQNAACADACAANPADWTERAISGNQVSVHRETTYVPSPGRARPRDRTNHHTCNVPAAHGTLHVRSLNSERQRPAYPIGHGHRAARAPHPQVARAAHAKTPQNHVHPPSPTGAIGVAASACETARKYVRALGSRGGGEWIAAACTRAGPCDEGFRIHSHARGEAAAGGRGARGRVHASCTARHAGRTLRPARDRYGVWRPRTSGVRVARPARVYVPSPSLAISIYPSFGGESTTRHAHLLVARSS